MISCNCIRTDPVSFAVDGINLADHMVTWLETNSPSNCLQGDLYTVAYAAGALIMSKMAIEGNLVTEADLLLVLEVMRESVRRGTEQWVETYPDRKLTGTVTE
jgi:hypothetical protein